MAATARSRPWRKTQARGGDGQHDPSDFQGSYCCGLSSLMSPRH